MQKKKILKNLACILSFFCVLACPLWSAEVPKTKEYTNSIGMKLLRIEPGSFEMGQLKLPLPFELLPYTGGRGDRIDSLIYGDFDEKPVHTVRITKPFYIGVFEVTNFQYELFDPEHKNLRGKEGFSSGDDEAVIYVSWYDAWAFCRWLSDLDGLPFRLPTEAEWNMPDGPELPPIITPAMSCQRSFAKRPKTFKWVRPPPTPGAYTICMVTLRSGAMTGMDLTRQICR